MSITLTPAPFFLDILYLKWNFAVLHYYSNALDSLDDKTLEFAALLFLQLFLFLYLFLINAF